MAIALIPEYAIGIRAWRALPGAAFAQPRCQRTAIRGMAVGAWEYRRVAGRLVKITHWEHVYP